MSSTGDSGELHTWWWCLSSHIFELDRIIQVHRSKRILSHCWLDQVILLKHTRHTQTDIIGLSLSLSLLIVSYSCIASLLLSPLCFEVERSNEDIWVHCVWEQWISADDELSLHVEFCLSCVYNFFLYILYFISHFNVERQSGYNSACMRLQIGLSLDAQHSFFVLITFHVLVHLILVRLTQPFEHDRLMPKSLWLTIVAFCLS